MAPDHELGTRYRQIITRPPNLHVVTISRVLLSCIHDTVNSFLSPGKIVIYKKSLEFALELVAGAIVSVAECCIS